MRNTDRILTRLERAGGALSEAVQITNEGSPPLANLMTSINIAVADLRRAVIRIQKGEDVDLVTRETGRTIREAFE
jgi:hypothetical protein